MQPPQPCKLTLRFKNQTSNMGSRIVKWHFLTVLLLGSAAMRAQDVSLSTPLSGSIGSSVYSESEQAGPSSSLIPGDANLTNPFIRTGISDPLNFLIESGYMSPYSPSESMVSGGTISQVPNLVLNDSTVAARFSEYRDNRVLMSGAGSASTRTGRAAAAGSTVSSASLAKMGGAASAAFGRATVLLPFAAGSSALAARQTRADSFLDSNALIAAASSSAYLDGGQNGASASLGSTPGVDADVSGVPPGNANSSMSSATSAASGILVPPASHVAYGPAPGELFPDVSTANLSSTGFQDSTTGTAGLLYESDDMGTSPLFSRNAEPADSPFSNVSAGENRFLNPSLMAGAPGSAMIQESPVPLSEARRKARMHAMIYNPGTALPSPFEQRKMEKEYLRKNSGRRVSHYPGISPSSIKP